MGCETFGFDSIHNCETNSAQSPPLHYTSLEPQEQSPNKFGSGGVVLESDRSTPKFKGFVQGLSKLELFLMVKLALVTCMKVVLLIEIFISVKFGNF